MSAPIGHHDMGTLPAIAASATLPQKGGQDPCLLGTCRPQLCCLPIPESYADGIADNMTGINTITEAERSSWISN